MVGAALTSPLRVGIVSWAHVHAPGLAASIASLPDARLSGIHDEDVERGRAAADERGVRWYAELPALFEGSDAVIIASTNARRRAYVEAAAAVGLHVLTEKPLATTLADGRAMVEACRTAGVQLGTAFPVRSSAAMQSLREAIRSGSIGEVRAARGTNPGQYPRSWFGDPREAGGGAVMDHVVHLADALRWLLDDEVQTVYAELGSLMHDLEVEDCGIATLEFRRGVFASIDCSWSRPQTYPTWGGVTLHVVADRATVDVDVFRQTLTHFDDQRSRVRSVTWGEDLTKMMVGDFVGAVREGRPVPISGEDGLRALEVAIASYRSAELGRTVRIAEL